VLLHGWACSAYSFEAVFQPLAAAGFRPTAIELPGHGLSERPLREDAYTRSALAQAAGEAMQALGVAGAAVLGHSLGTAIALELATRTEWRPAALVLVSPLGLDSIHIARAGSLISPRLMRRALPWAVPRSVVGWLLGRVYGSRCRPSYRDVDFYWAPTQFPDFGYATVALLRRFSWSALPDQQLAALTCPVLLLCGEEDRFVRAGVVRRRAARVPDARLVILPRTGHVPLQEAPQESVAEIVRFLADLRPGSSGR
jgi:pimeloyl-ACP methyl ester carboxylesterase